ncbi:GumC family protein [Mesorhizobium sp. 1B3]|uniref:GumC family protein n=1 Tax=Mesorhizobium sp. 1B3 TaxID=3243599 RepID=UPI003D95958E
MFDADNRERGRSAGSLLSFAASPGRESTHEGTPVPQADAVARHRAARSAREAAQSPLLAALAETGPHDTLHKTASVEPEVDNPPAAPRGEGEARRFGALIRDRLVGRRAQANKPERGATGPKAGPVSDAPAPVAGRGDDEIWRPLIDPMKVIMGVVDAKGLIVTTAVLGALLGVAVALSTPKKYQAAAEILVDPRELKLVERDLTPGGLPSDATLALVENQARILTSGTVLNKVVDKLNLAQDPEFNGQKGGGLGGIVSDLRSLLSRRDAAAVGDRKRALAVQHLAESLNVERGGKTFVIVVAVKTEEAEKSALIANTMTDVFLQTYGELQSGTAGRAADELNARLDELREGVEAAERKVESFKAENDLIDAQGRLITDDEIVRLNDQLTTARARTLELNAKAASSRNVGVEDAIGGAMPEELTSNVITELRSQYAAAKQQADRLSVRLGPRHPERLAIEAQLAGIREQIAGEMRRVVASIQTELKRAVQLEQQLSSRLAQLKVRQGSVSEDLVSLRELEREAAAKRAVYEGFLLRAKETGEQRDINTANMSVISRAFAPLNPLGPSRSMIALTGALLGFFAGVGLGAARGAWQSLRENTAARPRGAGGSSSPSDTPPPSPLDPRDPSRRPVATSPAADDHPAREHSGVPGHSPLPASAMPQGWMPEPPGSRQPLSHVHAQPAAHSYGVHQSSLPAYPLWSAGGVPPSDTQAPLRHNAANDTPPMASIDEIRHSLRDFHEAVREFADRRARRRSI